MTRPSWKRDKKAFCDILGGQGVIFNEKLTENQCTFPYLNEYESNVKMTEMC